MEKPNRRNFFLRCKGSMTHLHWFVVIYKLFGVSTILGTVYHLNQPHQFHIPPSSKSPACERICLKAPALSSATVNLSIDTPSFYFGGYKLLSGITKLGLVTKKSRKSYRRSPHTQSFPFFQRVVPSPAPLPLLICRKISQSESDNQAHFQKGMQFGDIAAGSSCAEI